MVRRNSGFGYLLCFAAGTIAGLVLGVTAFSALVSYKMDRYYKEIRRLETIINDKDVRLKKLEESLKESKNKQKYILEDIEVVLIYDGEEDEIDKITLEKHIKEKYTDLIGKEVKNIDLDLAIEVIDKRIMKIKDREYRLRVNRIALNEVLKIWVQVTKQEEE